MRPVSHPLLRVVCSLAVGLGLGLSSLEEMGCDSPGQGVTIQASPSSAGGEQRPHRYSTADGPGVSHCSPCIHTYPAGFAVRLAPALMVDGNRARFSMSPGLMPTSHVEPLVPSPIA